MQGYDLIRLKAEAQVAKNYLDKAVDHAADDPTRAFYAVEDARKHVSQMHTTLFPEHLQACKRMS